MDVDDADVDDTTDRAPRFSFMNETDENICEIKSYSFRNKVEGAWVT